MPAPKLDLKRSKETDPDEPEAIVHDSIHYGLQARHNSRLEAFDELGNSDSDVNI